MKWSPEEHARRMAENDARMIDAARKAIFAEQALIAAELRQEWRKKHFNPNNFNTPPYDGYPLNQLPAINRKRIKQGNKTHGQLVDEARRSLLEDAERAK